MTQLPHFMLCRHCSVFILYNTIFPYIISFLPLVDCKLLQDKNYVFRDVKPLKQGAGKNPEIQASFIYTVPFCIYKLLGAFTLELESSAE